MSSMYENSLRNLSIQRISLVGREAMVTLRGTGSKVKTKREVSKAVNRNL